ncbi:3-carboxyethylcatechol 2,3-dioxygenase [Insolitispirillum peregrinum]|uniref:2,3-dihydroxyphenylpropionate/2,3-dihydroxicinnamic acid 1,2-dioxygenase n=1 Tax=Insolitispirillum peregrinum TaxID=80876 RepID=A0A1N7NBR4_9PROT|nr:3-carboxyethylcatechol 2,3-dioxygenase [Insolitispirillum peregrinum]SIS95730.1 2,3-dihydroxyphenylpropionate 1,2-dioxygenase [Insolitispirillum peregrinum]
MPVKLVCASHTPMMEFIHPPADVEAKARQAFKDLAADVAAYDPEVIVLFAPDHFNGFFYDLMPPFCIGLRAACAGDWDIGHGPLNVPEALALDLVQALQAEDLDVPYSYRMQADHGFTQPLELLAGSVGRYPVIPIFINGAARPLPPCRRAVQLGQAVGRFLSQRPERVLVIGSGGLSHDPPTPQFGSVPPEIEEFLIAGRNPTPEARNTRQQRVLNTGRLLAEGKGESLRLNAEWDMGLIDSFSQADMDRFMAMTNEEILEHGGRGGQEIRAWIAAFACMQAVGEYRTTTHYYHPIDEWIAGMAMVSADSVAARKEAQA